MSVASPMRTDEWLGRYRIIRKIGQGGMGEVYLAEDPKLDRQIALKVLNSDFSSDSDRMKRFVHEAKTASALNHPNIITIYEIDDENDIPFIAMEFVEGETLGRRMKTEPLSPVDSLEIAIQVASALSAAHEASVVHRDIKPDNVIIRPDGIVKVLDFGLAKQLPNGSVPDSGDELPHVVNTTPGMVLGTVAYMSPEQARGKLVDARSDIFSFGSMFYQMVSGKLPFTGENDVDTVGSILHKNPRPLSQSARYIPHDVEVVIKKTLRKNRDERYQSTRELLADLRDIRAQMSLELMSDGSGNLSDYERALPTERISLANFADRTDPISRAPSTLSGALIGEFREHPLKSFAVSLLVAAVLAISAYGAFRIIDSFQQKPESFQTMKFSKLTYSGNVAAEQAAISPDGKYLAYVIQQPGQQSLWVKQTATDSNVQTVAASSQKFSGIKFSPDANHIYYTTLEREGLNSLYQVPVLGGPVRKLVADAKGPIAFSPDGKTILFVKSERGLILANADGSNPRPLNVDKSGAEWLRFDWSPDGKIIAASYYLDTDDLTHLIGISPVDGSESSISLDSWYRIRGLAWLQDGSGMIVSGRDLPGSYSQIWRVDYPSGNRQRVTNDLNNYQGISLTADGQNIVSTQPDIISDIWVTTKDGDDKPVKVTLDSGKGNGFSGVAWAPDDQIVYTARTGEQLNIWIAERNGMKGRQLTFDSKENFSPVVSPVETCIVFVSTRNGNPDIWKMDLEGGSQVPLVASSASEAEPSFSKDGKWVLFGRIDENDEATIWKVSIDGGDPIQVTKTASEKPIVSPNDQYIAANFGVAKADSSIKLSILPLSGGDPVRVFDQASLAKSRNVRWSIDGKSIIYIDGKNQVDNLWIQPLDNSAPKPITNFESDRIFRFDVSPVDGRIVVARGNNTSDVVMISNFR